MTLPLSIQIDPPGIRTLRVPDIFFINKVCIAMKYKALLLIPLLFLLSNEAVAGFDFCSGNTGGQGGSGTFQQQIPLNGIVEVGELPVGIADVEINLSSSKDIDIQLYDKETGEKIIHWPYGLLSRSGYQSVVYHDVLVEWSGYNGDGSGPGNEFVRISGASDSMAPTKRAFIMKVFGYNAGSADVDYSWAGANCDASAGGSSSFAQQIVKNAVVDVGQIPVGINNLQITLESAQDVDIQLYDADNGTAIIAWPAGLLNGSSTQSTVYENMDIEWSGYNGDGSNPGREYIKITGKTTKSLKIKAFGYQSGLATVTYSWGDNVGGGNGNTGAGNSAEEQIKSEILGLINQARSQGRNCGGTYFPAVAPLAWNSKLYQAALKHTNDMVQNNFFDHTGSDGSNAGTRITAAGYSWYTYRENIAAGYFSAQEVVSGWLSSTGHCSNIMNSLVTEMGVAKAKGGSYGMYWTQNFARPF